MQQLVVEKCFELFVAIVTIGRHHLHNDDIIVDLVNKSVLNLVAHARFWLRIRPTIHLGASRGK